MFAKILAGIALAFLIVGTLVGVAVPMMPSQSESVTSMIAHLSGLALLTAVWLICRRGQYSLAVLELLDAGAVIGSGVAWSLFVHPSVPDSIYWGVDSVMLTLLARAIVVPSSAARTLRVTVLASLPLLVSIGFWLVRLSANPSPNELQPALATAMFQLLLLLSSIAMATITSRIMYDLRQKVREANEIGPYVLEEKLGMGGMGEVWRARHRFLVRAAAVKLIRLEVLGGADPAVLLRRFEREARATAALRSPHTVQLYDFGQAEDGTLYYVMEMLVGVDLEKLISKFGPVPAERAIHILKQVCHSLDEAHQNGLTHRDVKPANVFVSGIGSESDFVKVLDFGLVRVQHESPEADQVKLTAEGSVGGTPAYMAPEVALGEASYDHRIDIYAVGCIGYWLLTGKLVFEADTPMKMIVEHARTPPPRPQTRTELPIPPELEQIIMDCLEKDPARRPATAGELALRLARVPVPQQWTAERAERWWRTHLPQQTQEPRVSEVLLAHEGSPESSRELRRRRAD
jgi:serine/threonine-protein kinase